MTHFTMHHILSLTVSGTGSPSSSAFVYFECFVLRLRKNSGKMAEARVHRGATDTLQYCTINVLVLAAILSIFRARS
jgi:hypothetical protein